MRVPWQLIPLAALAGAIVAYVLYGRYGNGGVVLLLVVAAIAAGCLVIWEWLG